MALALKHHVNICSADYQRKKITDKQRPEFSSRLLTPVCLNPAFNFCVMRASVVLDVVHISYEGRPRICPIKMKIKDKA